MVIDNPFSGLINGVLQGHAIAQQLKMESLQNEAYQRAKDREDRENQLADLQTKMYLQTHGRPVTAGTIQQSFNAAMPDATGLDIPAAPQQVSFVRPVDKSRLASFKTSTGDKLDYELYTPEEQLQRQLDAVQASGLVNARNAGMAELIKNRMVREDLALRRRTEGVEPPDILVRAGLAVPGEKLLQDEVNKMIPQAQTILSPVLKDVAPGASLVDVAKPSINAPPAAPPAPILPSGNPLATAAAPSQQARDAFVASAKEAASATPTAGAATPATGGAKVLYSAPAKQSDKNVTQAELEWMSVHDPDPQVRAQADAALKRHTQDVIAGRPVTNVYVPPASALTPGTKTIDDVPAGIRAEVQQVLGYRKPLPPNSRSNPRNAAINDWVARVGAPDPSRGYGGYNAALYPARSKYISSVYAADPNSVGGQINSLNTMAKHMNELWEGAGGLNNKAFKGFNNFANWLKASSGSDFAKPFEVARLGVSEELGRLLKGGVATKDEVEGWLRTIDASDSPQALQNTMRSITKIAKERIETLHEQYISNMGEEPASPFVRPPAQAIFDKILGTGAAGGHVIEVGGKRYQYKGTGATDDMANYTEIPK